MVPGIHQPTSTLDEHNQTRFLAQRFWEFLDNSKNCLAERKFVKNVICDISKKLKGSTACKLCRFRVSVIKLKKLPKMRTLINKTEDMALLYDLLVMGWPIIYDKLKEFLDKNSSNTMSESKKIKLENNLFREPPNYKDKITYSYAPHINLENLPVQRYSIAEPSRALKDSETQSLNFIANFCQTLSNNSTNHRYFRNSLSEENPFNILHIEIQHNKLNDSCTNFSSSLSQKIQITNLGNEFQEFKSKNIELFQSIVYTLIVQTWQERLTTNIDPDNIQVCKELSQLIVSKTHIMTNYLRFISSFNGSAYRCGPGGKFSVDFSKIFYY